MKTNKIKTHYRRNLPHIQPLGATFFVTFRLKDSIPTSKLVELKSAYLESLNTIQAEDQIALKRLKENKRKRFFKKYDDLLDSKNTGPHYLKKPEIAKIITKELHRFDGELYELVAYCVMSNHVHILINTSVQFPEGMVFQDLESLDFEPLQNIMKRIKGPTAVYANRLLKREGKFWQRESYDHYVRNEKEFGNIIAYILNNPVNAGIVKEWVDYPFSYVKESE